MKKTNQQIANNDYKEIYIKSEAGSGKSGSTFEFFEPIIKQIGEKQFTGILYDFKSPQLKDLICISFLETEKSVSKQK